MNFKIPQFPDFEISITAFENVTNSESIRFKVATLPYAFLDARMIYSQEQLYAALYRVLVEQKYNKLRTKTIHSEIMLCLSPTSNIGDAFKKFGIKEDSNTVICLHIKDRSDEPELPSLSSIVEGQEISLSKEFINQHRDIGMVGHVYKINGEMIESSTEDQVSSMIVNMIQLRGL
ncbi:Hypothetical protein J6898_01128 [Nakaseomyces glabratus]